MKMYAKTDEFLKKLKRLIRIEFGQLPFDNLNVSVARKETKALYKKLKAFNRSNYIEVAREGTRWAINALTDEEKDKVKGRLENAKLDALVASVLASWNFVTGYLYEPEVERKRSRQAEEMMTAKESGSRTKFRQAMDRCAALWFLQSSQYAVNVEDKSIEETWIEAGITEVMWNAEDDAKTCKVCRERDGKIYRLGELPPKPHYNCRCTYSIVREDSKTQAAEKP